MKHRSTVVAAILLAVFSVIIYSCGSNPTSPSQATNTPTPNPPTATSTPRPNTPTNTAGGSTATFTNTATNTSTNTPGGNTNTPTNTSTATTTNTATSTATNTSTSTITMTPTNTPNGIWVMTLAGSGSPAFANGTGTAASFNMPHGVAVDTAGNVYVADLLNNRIRQISPGGVVSTLAGSGIIGSYNATGTNASFYYPQGVAVDTAGNVYVADADNNLIREITSGGVVSTLAGGGVPWATNGPGTTASFNVPEGVAVDTAGNVYVADDGNDLIRQITSGGLVSTFAGSGAIGHANGLGPNASFYAPYGVAVDTAGNVYVADADNNLIREITSGGTVSTLAGQPQITGSVNGAGTTATFNLPQGVAVDTAGNVYVADYGNNLIREITSGGVVSTLAGGGSGTATNGTGTTASFSGPSGVAVDTAGNVYVADMGNNMIRKITQ